MSTGGGTGGTLEDAGIAAASVALAASTAGASVPAEMALASTAAIAAGTASYESDKYQQGIAKNNQQLALQNENNAQLAGNSAQQQQEQKNAAQSGLIRASFAANGIDVNDGSANQVEQSQKALGQTDLQNIHQNYQNQAMGYGYAATNSSNQSDLYAGQANFAIPTSVLSSANAANGRWGTAFGNSQNPSQAQANEDYSEDAAD